MRDLIVLLICFGSLPLTLIQPFIGLLVYSWLAYFLPHEMVWGDLPQVSLFVALAMLAGLVLATGREKWLSLRAQTVLLISLGVWVGLSALMAVDPGLARPWAIRIGKLLLIAVVTTGLVRTHRRFRLLYLVIAGSLGLLGFKYGFYSLARGGGRIYSGPGGFFPDNNGLALALCMGIPLVVGIGLTETRPIVRRLSVVLAVFSGVAVIFTFSRGGLLALAVVLVVLLARSGRPVAVGVVLAASLAGFVMIASQDLQHSYLDRAASIAEYREDPSAMGRIEEWGTAIRVAADYPILGVGPDNLQVVRPTYVLDGSDYRTTHNSFLQILVASGVPALLMLGGLLALSIWRLEGMRRSASPAWARTYASMLQCSLIAYVVGGSLGDGAYFDLTYHLIAMTLSLELAVEAEGMEPHALESAGRSRNVDWWREAPADARWVT